MFVYENWILANNGIYDVYFVLFRTCQMDIPISPSIDVHIKIKNSVTFISNLQCIIH